MSNFSMHLLLGVCVCVCELNNFSLCTDGLVVNTYTRARTTTHAHNESYRPTFYFCHINDQAMFMLLLCAVASIKCNHHQPCFCVFPPPRRADWHHPHTATALHAKRVSTIPQSAHRVPTLLIDSVPGVKLPQRGPTQPVSHHVWCINKSHFPQAPERGIKLIGTLSALA